MANQLIPLTSDPSQSMTISVAIDGATKVLRLEIQFNTMAQYWALNISDQSGKPLLRGLPLVTGQWPAANLLGPYGYLKIGSAYVVNASSSQRDYPGIDGLGTDFVLIWADTAQ